MDKSSKLCVSALTLLAFAFFLLFWLPIGSLSWLLPIGPYFILFLVALIIILLVLSIRTDTTDYKKRSYEDYPKKVRKSDYDPSTSYKSSASISKPTPQAVLTGGVYLIKSGKYYKIGKADVFDRRIKQIKLQQPEPVEVVHKIYTANALKAERQWHLKFAHKRKNGEWFELSEAEVAEFKSQSKA